MATRAIRRVCVFCGSSFGRGPRYQAHARALAEALVGAGMGLVYGGTQVGLMGVLADTVLAQGGEVLGVIPEPLVALEVAHRGLTQLHVVGSMHERKAMMADLSDAFVALPGGLGTLEETFEIITWAQLGLHTKPVGLLDTDGYYGPLLAFIDRAIAEGFIAKEHTALLLTAPEPEQLLEAILHYRPPALPPKWWLKPEQT
jgi:uncharacterized protein (TIGR00730 family)